MTDSILLLEQLLDHERRLLLSGELGALETLLPSKETLVEDLNTNDNLHQDVLERLDMKLRRNQLLLNGAMEGIRAVSDRLAVLKKVHSSIETYDSGGNKQTIDIPKKRRIEKRA